MYRSLPKLAVLAAILPAVALPTTAFAADPHSRDIQIESWSWGTSSSSSHASGGGGGAGKVSYSDLSVMMSLEKGPSGTGKTLAAEVLA